MSDSDCVSVTSLPDCANDRKKESKESERERERVEILCSP